MRSNILPTHRLCTNVLQTSPARKSAPVLLAFDLVRRQCLAGILIFTLLLPVISFPAGSSMADPQHRTGQFEPVNERLPVWIKIWRELQMRVEAWRTPWRAINLTYDEVSRGPAQTDDPAAIRAAVPADESVPPVKNPPAGTLAVTKKPPANEVGAVAPETSAGASFSRSLPAVSRSPFIAAAALLNQLPPDERESVYHYENNLGHPPGQAEIDSPNQAAAIPIKHRAGTANFSFALPLAGLAGRGLSAGVGLIYNSRTWNKSCSEFDSSGNCLQYRFTYDVERSWIGPGFSSGFGYLETSAELRNVVYDPPNNSWHTEITPLGLTDPDGTRHQLICKTIVPIPGAPSHQRRCGVYAANDGTLVEFQGQPFIANPNNSTTVNTSTYSQTGFSTVYPNGTKVWYSGGFGSGTQRRHYPVIIQDRNGNRIRITYRGQTGRIDLITDTLNRQIRFYYENDPEGNPDKLVAVTIPGMNAGEEIQTARFYYEVMPLNAQNAFLGLVNAPTSIRVLRLVYFPATKTAYKYEYHPNYGMITRVSSLSGVLVSDVTDLTVSGAVTSEGVTAAATRYNFPDGSVPLADVPKYTKRLDEWLGRTAPAPQETFYAVTESGGERISKITVRDNGFDVVRENTFRADGLLKETAVKKIYGPGGQYTQLMEKIRYTWGANRTVVKTETTNEAGLAQTVEYEYDQYNNETKIREYDYAPAGSLGTLLRTTEIGYETGDGWLRARLFSLVKSVIVKVGGQVVSKTLYEYDHNGSDAMLVRRGAMDAPETAGTHDPFYNPDLPALCRTTCPDDSHSTCEDPGPDCTVSTEGYSPESAFRGNLTKSARLLDVHAAAFNEERDEVTGMNYDILGNLVSTTLSCCSLRTFEYDPSHFTYPVAQTSGGRTLQLTTSATYNYRTGLKLSSTDENEQVTLYEYEPDTLRIRKTTSPNGGFVLREYSDKLVSNPAESVPRFVRTTTTLEANRTVQRYVYFDGRGLRLREAVQTSEGWSISAVAYDSVGRPHKIFNPFYAAVPNGAVPPETKFTEITEIDALGRVAAVKFQDETSIVREFSRPAATPSGFNKTFAIVTDQAGGQRRQVFDALGRVVRVDEPDAAGRLGDVTAPFQPTFYEYDGNDNLTRISQSDSTVTQARHFRYDALSRLTHERQTEAVPTLNDQGEKVPTGGLWTKYLRYTADGRLEYGVDANGVKTSFTYDGLNRLRTVNYTGETDDPTPGLTYSYDEPREGFFNRGRLTRVETAAAGEVPATSAEFDYDAMGRVIKHRQTIAGQQYPLDYSYNLAGQLAAVRYPSGRRVSLTYDDGGRLSEIAEAGRTYAGDFRYRHHGGLLSSIRFGNGTSADFGFNDRRQMTSQSIARGAEVVQKFVYGYGQIDEAGRLDPRRNNGQLGRVESFIGNSRQWTQNFRYDELGRLAEVAEYRGDTSALSYRYRFDFDRFGNLYRRQAANPPTGQENPLPFVPIEESDIDQSTNRFSDAARISYDEAGRVRKDGKFRFLSYEYDATGRMVRMTQENNFDARSIYDAFGRRVATKIGGVWHSFIYDIFGRLAAEYGGSAPVDEGGVKYVVQDWQGSVRTVLNNAGFVLARNDYQAFGGEISAGVGLRSPAQGYGAPAGTRQGYGLTEEDTATGLQHTWFRKLEELAGRWTSPDPYNGSISLGDPQSLNRYSYVQNEPTNFVDPTGLLMASIYCTLVWVWVPSVEGGGDWVDKLVCHALFDGFDTGRRRPGAAGAPGGDSPGGSGDCAVNPVTGQPGFNRDPVNQTGHLRSDKSGAGAFDSPRGGASHRALDIAGELNQTPVLAPLPGVVSGSGPTGDNLGEYVKILHDNGMESQFGHIRAGSGAAVGTRVEAGDQVAVVGNTGNANAPGIQPHVHWILKDKPGGRRVDPEEFLNRPCSPGQTPAAQTN